MDNFDSVSRHLDSTGKTPSSHDIKVLICGSRGFNDYVLMKVQIMKLLDRFGTTITIISGGAKGADKLAEDVAKQLGISITILEPDWDKHGKGAGMIRNNAMLDMKPNIVLAFWDGNSKGTKHTISEARKRKIEVHLVQYGGVIK